MMQEKGTARRARNRMYFETGQGSALSSHANHGADQVTIEARAYGMARRYKPFLVNTVVGFIGPEYLEDGPQISRAALEDHFMGKLLGLPMGCDACFTYHARMSQDELESLKVLSGRGGLRVPDVAAGRRRHHAQLPVDELSRHPDAAAACCGTADAGVRRVARRARHLERRSARAAVRRRRGDPHGARAGSRAIRVALRTSSSPDEDPHEDLRRGAPSCRTIAACARASSRPMAE